VSIIASGPVHFGKIPDEHWYQPSWINETKAQEEREKMVEEGVIYGGSLSYVCPGPSFPVSSWF
jgi:alpha 1,2-mannosyltransferase